MPLILKPTSSCRVSSHNISTAPASKIGSFEGENSKIKLHNVDEATANISLFGCCNNFIKGFQTDWS